MVTKAELIAAIASLKDDDEVLVAVLTPKDDEEEAGFSETEGTTAPKADDSDDEDPGYVEYGINEIEVVDATDDSGAKAALLYVDIESDDDEDELFVDEDGHLVDEDDNYVDEEGNPSDKPVKAPPEEADA